MSNLSRLPIATHGDPPPPGYSNRVRAAVASAERDALDDEVIAAGGCFKVRRPPGGRGLRLGRKVQSAQQPPGVTWYVVPDSARSPE